jgi:hypothetical protein
MKQIGMKYGLFTGLFYIVVGTLNFMFEFSASSTMAGIATWVITFGITFAIVYVAVKEYREEFGSMSAGQGLKLGVTIGLIAGLIAAVFTFIYTQWLDPDAMTRQMQATMDSMEDRGMSDEEIEAAMSISEKFMDPMFTLPVTIISYTIGGLIKGVISGSILKKDVPV